MSITFGVGLGFGRNQALWFPLFHRVAVPLMVLLSIVVFSSHYKIAMAGDTYDGWMFYDGNELVELCKSPDREKRNACSMYICGMIDGWAAEYIITSKKLYQICLPKGITCDQLSQTIAAHLEKNPESRKSGGGGVVGYGLKLAYPCK